MADLEFRDYIQALHTEAERALYEHVTAERWGRAGRVGKLRALLGTLRSVDAEAVAGLFFGAVTGTCNMEEHVLAMFNEKSAI